MSNVTALQLMRVALQQYATKESPAGSNRTKYGKAYGLNGQPWCAIFSWWCGWTAAGQNKNNNPVAKSASAADIEDLTVRNKGGVYVLKQTSNNNKKKAALPNVRFGDLISFNFSGGSSRAHTGIVVGRWGSYLYCIEGNTSFSEKGSQSNGGCVALRSRYYTTGVCIVRPAYKAGGFFCPSTPYTGSVPKLPARGFFKYGDKSDQVAALQQALSWTNGYKLSVDKELGPCSFAETVIFQVANGLEPDGRFGAECLKKLNELIEKNKGGKPTPPTPTPTPTPEPPKHPALYVPQEGDKCYDLSDYQGVLSKAYFDQIKAKGVKCVILRSSYTRILTFDRRVDAHFHENIKNAIAAGMHIGIYHYSSAASAAESAQEAQFCLNTIQDYIEYIDLPVGFDLEFGRMNGKAGRFNPDVAKKLGRAGVGKLIHGFTDPVKAAGYEPMLYANLTTFNNYLPEDIYQQMKIWVAQWDSKCEYKHPYYLWQFTSNNGKLDEDVFGTQDTKKKESPKPTALPVLPARGWLQKGDKGSEVRKMQEILLYLGFSCGRYGADADFGGDTKDAVIAFQKKYGLSPDGGWGTQCNDKAADLLGLPRPERSKAQKLTEKAIACAWPKGTPRKTYTYPSGSPTPEYKAALNRAYPDRSKWGKQTRAGASCDVFAGTCIRDSGVDPKFPRGLDEQIPYIKKSDKFTKIDVKSSASLQAGDVIIYTKKKGGGHICIYRGSSLVCEAGYNTKRYGCTVELAKSHFNPTYIKNTYSFFGVYRPKG